MAGVRIKIPGVAGQIEARADGLSEIVADEMDRVLAAKANSAFTPYTDFRRSDNIEDRRDESWWSQNAPPTGVFQILRDVIENVGGKLLSPNNEPSPLAVQAGYNDIPFVSTIEPVSPIAHIRDYREVIK
jgi:hypothetical protein